MADELQTLPAGHRLGAYEVQRVLGTGTFGNVYLCAGKEPGKTVAVREYVPRGVAVRGDGLRVQPRSSAADRAFAAGLARFVERAERMMAIDHPGVVRIHEVFQANTTACVAMDYVAGTPLSTLLQTGETLPEAKLVAYLRPVATGLLAMHRAGVAHGNLGPGSVIVGDGDEPVLIGLAVPAQDEFGTVGKPGYAPIEHYSARPGLASVRSDVYSLAAIVYRCVTGVTPPEAPVRAERDTLVPAQRAAQGKGRYRQDLLVAVDAALTLDPEGRPEGIEALRDALAVSDAGRRASVPQARVKREAAKAAKATKEDTAQASGQRTGARGSMAARRDTGRSGRYGILLGTAAAVLIATFAGVYFLAPDDAAVPPEPPPPAEVEPPPPAEVEPPPPAEVEPPPTAPAEPPPGQPVPPAVEPGPSTALADVETPLTDGPAATPSVSESPPPDPPSELPAAGTALLVVVTNPPGAEVFLDGEAVGETPFELPGLATGEYRIAVRHPYYDEVESDLEVSEGAPTRFERELVRATGTLQVTTTPGDAWIEFQGERLADATPATLAELPAGLLALTLGAPGYTSINVEAEVPKDDIRTLEFALERAFGTLTLALSPADAEVSLPDLELSYEPGVSLPEGAHRVTVAKQGFATFTDTIDIAGATRREIVLEPGLHALTVATDPPGAVVTFVDGADAYTPGVLMPPGEYRLQASLLGYAPWAGTVRHGTAPTVYDVSLEFVTAEYTDPLSSGGEGPAMVVVPAGGFRMGCVSGAACTTSEQPVRQVTVETSYSMSKYEVTFEDYDRFARATGRDRPDDLAWGRGQRPVINVSWQDAVAYAEWLSSETGRRYALPTEAEWEYAARAGAETAYAWGSAIDEEANCDDCSRRRVRRTVPVGSFRANSWGLFDMHGNVWEWVRDCWNVDYSGAPGDSGAWTEGDCQRRVLRGGSWFNAAAFARSATRLSGGATMRGSIAGFRVVAHND